MIEYVKLKNNYFFTTWKYYYFEDLAQIYETGLVLLMKKNAAKKKLKNADIKHMHHFYTKTSRKSIQTFIYPASYLERRNKFSTNTNNKQLALSGPKPEEITNCLPVWAPKKVHKKVQYFLISSLLLKLFVVNGKGKINSKVTFKLVIFRGLPMLKNSKFFLLN